MKLRYVLVFIVLFAAVICAPFLIDTLLRMLLRNAGGHRGTVTLGRFHNLAIGIHILVEDTNEPPPKDTKALSEYVRRDPHYFSKLFGGKGFDPNTGTIFDSWGTPVKLISKTEYILISAGENQIVENGKGDDIVYTFDPFDPNKKPEIIIGGKTLKAK
jgi:hypothetical protein